MLPSLSLDFCWDFCSEFGVNRTRTWIHHACYHCAGWWWCNGVGDVFLAHFRPLSANWASFICHGLPEHCFWPWPFMATMDPSTDGYFQEDNAPCHKAWIISNWFLEHGNEFTVLKCPQQSPDLNPIEHIWDVVEWELCALDVHPTNLHQLQDAFLSIWASISKECLQHLVESMLHRIKAVLKVKVGQTQY